LSIASSRVSLEGRGEFPPMARATDPNASLNDRATVRMRASSAA
jgi:hypothetical protein